MNETTGLQQLINAITELSKRVDALEARGGASGKRTIWEIGKLIESRQDLCDSLRNCHCKVVATGPVWTDEEARKKFVKLKKEIRELNEQLSSM